jgi:hypothetical protein
MRDTSAWPDRPFQHTEAGMRVEEVVAKRSSA